jgi:hypothetical protein
LLVAGAAGADVAEPAGADVGALMDGDDEQALSSEANAPPARPTVSRLKRVLRVSLSGGRIKSGRSF